MLVSRIKVAGLLLAMLLVLCGASLWACAVSEPEATPIQAVEKEEPAPLQKGGLKPRPVGPVLPMSILGGGFVHHGGLAGTAFSADGKFLACSYHRKSLLQNVGLICVWDLATGRMLHHFRVNGPHQV